MQEFIWWIHSRFHNSGNLTIPIKVVTWNCWLSNNLFFLYHLNNNFKQFLNFLSFSCSFKIITPIKTYLSLKMNGEIALNVTKMWDYLAPAKSFKLPRQTMIPQNKDAGYLMDDSAARLPEANSIFSTCRGQKVVHFTVNVLGSGQIFTASFIGFNQMVTVDGGWHCHLG